jgi:hypothetical protein
MAGADLDIFFREAVAAIDAGDLAALEELFDQKVPSTFREYSDPGPRIPARARYGVQLTAGPFVFSFPGELQLTM